MRPHPRSLGLALACSLAAAACSDNAPPATGTTGGPALQQPAATATASTPPAAESSAPPPATAEPAPPPTASASASVAASASASAKPVAKAPVDAKAKDAGTPAASSAVAAADAGAPPPPASEAERIAQQIDAVFVPRKIFSARFKQQVTPKITGEPKNSSGTIVAEKPYKFSFRYDPPNKMRVVSDGVTIKIYTPEDNQMTETPVQKTQYPGAVGFMMGNGIRSSFSFALDDKIPFPGGKVLLGTPPQASLSYESVRFFVDSELLGKGDPGLMRRVLIVDQQGNRNRFDFENVTQPASVDPAEFTFTPPPGTNIVR